MRTRSLLLPIVATVLSMVAPAHAVTTKTYPVIAGEPIYQVPTPGAAALTACEPEQAMNAPTNGVADNLGIVPTAWLARRVNVSWTQAVPAGISFVNVRYYSATCTLLREGGDTFGPAGGSSNVPSTSKYLLITSPAAIDAKVTISG